MAVALEPLIVFALLVLTWQAVHPLLPVLLLLTASAQVVLLVLSWWRVLWILAMIVKFAALRPTIPEDVLEPLIEFAPLAVILLAVQHCLAVAQLPIPSVLPA